MNRKCFEQNKLIVNIINVVLLIFMCVFTACSRGDGTVTSKKVIILGFDGMDYKILSRMLSEGKLPNFQALKNEGGFLPLATSVPPQSPVAWSNFITGMNPGGHGIFDFIHRDSETMLPYLSTSKTESSKRKISIGNWVFPLSKGKVHLLRKGKSFWEILDDHDIPTTIIRIPANFPPVKTKGRTISGMGTPDLLGTYGTFSYFTDDPSSVDKEKISGGGHVYEVEVINNAVKDSLVGPRNELKKDRPSVKIPFSVYIDTQNPVAKINIQDSELLLNQGEWSKWVKLEFEMMPVLSSVSGICRFFLKEVRPNFKLYLTPINIDPSDPGLPLSTPEDYSEDLYKEIGYFYTQGMPEDTKALSSGVLNYEEFLQQSRFVLDERLKMFDYELNRFGSGLLFFYFSSVDQNSHMFWRPMDKNHPAYNAETDAKYSGVIESLYIEMDNVLGKTLNKMDDHTTLIVMSDHGFAPFYRSFNLNTWLKENGYVTLIDESKQGEQEFFLNVDWRQTKAYNLGLNGLYVNLYGREKYGIVQPGPEREALVDEIIEKLLAVRDPQTGEQVIAKVYKAEDVYSGPYVQEASDLLIGYSLGYRASWETTLGKFPKQIISVNRELWSGDHCMISEGVPGIVLSNKKLKSNHPALYDLAPTILAEFGIVKEDDMVGESIF